MKPHFSYGFPMEDDLSQQGGIHIHIDDVGRFLETDELLESAKTEPSWGTLMFLAIETIGKP